jgi:hypothetical protein
MAYTIEVLPPVVPALCNAIFAGPASASAVCRSTPTRLRLEAARRNAAFVSARFRAGSRTQFEIMDLLTTK